MPKRSILTTRQTPVTDVSTETDGGLRIHGESFTVETEDRIELVDITDRVMSLVHRLGVSEGMVSLWSMHTTCAILINEVQQALLADTKRFLEELVERDAHWLHNDPEYSDCSRQNADSHLRAMMLGHSLNLQISGGEVVLGQWQRILIAELDGPRPRQIRQQVWGITKA